MDMKKILKIRKGEYLMRIRLDNAVETTYHVEDAMDISDWSLEQFSHIVGSLRNVGLTEVEAILIPDEDEYNVEVFEDEKVEDEVVEDTESAVNE